MSPEKFNTVVKSFEDMNPRVDNMLIIDGKIRKMRVNAILHDYMHSSWQEIEEIYSHFNRF